MESTVAVEEQASIRQQNTQKFYSVLTHRVSQYFKENNISKHANGTMIAKTVFILFGTIGTYALLLSNTLPAWAMLIVAMANGFFTALIGLNIAHDAIHEAYSSKPFVNKALSVCFNIIGANDYIWRIKHNLIHHTYTNVPGYDDDLENSPIIRMNPKQELWWIHRFQHIYVFFLYPLASLSWVFAKDYSNFFKTKIGQYDNSKKPAIEWFRLIFYKITYYAIFIVIPVMVIELPWYYLLIGFIALHLVEGLTLSLVFQLAHVVEHAAFPLASDKGKLQKGWAEHQMYTTADFARTNPVVNFLFGGLNFQIEHHLFPKVCHVHYRKIAPIVKYTAEEFDLPYIENPTFFGALKSHVNLMKEFGRTQNPVLSF